MARAAKKTTGSSKAKKKRWVQIHGKDMFNDRFLGETPTYDLTTLQGKELKVNLMTVTNDIKKQHINLTFKIDSIEGDKAAASIVKYHIIPAHIKRIVRRKRNKVDLSFLVESKDKVVARIKPLIITRNPTYKSVQTVVRKAAEAFIINHFKENNFQQVMNEIISNRFQMSLRDAVKTIYPLRSVEIRIFRVATEKEQANPKAIKREAQAVKIKKGVDKRPDRRNTEAAKVTPTPTAPTPKATQEKEAEKEEKPEPTSKDK